MKLLSLTGGGTSGYMTCKLLEKVEDVLGVSIADRVDMIAGTSTGAIIAAGLARGYSASYLALMYKQLQEDIFGKPKGFIRSLFQPKYDSSKLIEIAKDVYGDETFGSEDLKCHLLIPALSLSRPELMPKFWKTYDDKDSSVRLRDAVLASISIPAMFPPYKIGDKYYYDGGMCVNNPTLPAIADIIKMPKLGCTPQEDIHAVVINTDFHSGFSNPEKFKGLYSIYKDVISFCIDGSERASDYVTRAILSEGNFINVVPQVYIQADSNDWESMEREVLNQWELHGDNLIRYFKDV